MVLQRGHAAVWGWADADATIELAVLAGDKTLAQASTHAASNGVWNISVSVTAQKTTAIKIVSLSDTIVLDDVAFGDVFLCSG
jgi:sialate O-acetylesterase